MDGHGFGCRVLGDGMSDADLRKMWRKAGGDFHGPNVETGTMPEAKLLRLLRTLALGQRP